MGRRNTLGLSVIAALLLLAPSASAQTAGSIGEGFEQMVTLPGGSFSAVTIRGRSGLYFLSANGRYVIRGELTDTWSGTTLSDIDAVRASATTLDLSALDDFWDDLAPETFGTGPEIVTVFVDPLCAACAAHMAALEPWFATHRFRIVPVPALGKRSGQLIRHVTCARDRDAARRAVRTHRYETPLLQDPACDVKALQRRVVVMQLLGITEVPFSIASSGQIFKGGGDRFGSWLAEMSR